MINRLSFLARRRGMSTITVMRHAETNWNKLRVQGQSLDPNICLTSAGRNAIGIKLANIAKPDLLICSTLPRCIETAQIWLDADYGSKVKVVLNEGIQEINAGCYEGRHLNTLANDALWRSWMDTPHEFKGFPGGETLHEFQCRVLKAFSDICAEHTYAKISVCVISHAIVMGVLMCHLSGDELSNLWKHIRSIDNLQRIELTPENAAHLVRLHQNNQFAITRGAL